MADGKHIEVAKAYVTIVPSLEGSQKTISNEMGVVTESAAKEAGEKSGKTLGSSLAKGLKATAAVIGATMTAVTAAAIATGRSFIKAANDVSSMGDSIGDNAAKLGISTRAYQEWDFVLKRAGSSIDSMKTSMKTLQNAAAGNNAAFKTLGITQKELQTLSPEQLFNRTVTALQNVEDKTTRTALASKLLGRGAMELGTVFDMTSEETEQAKQKMYELGAYMDDDAISASDKYQDTMTDLQDSIAGLKTRVMTSFLPGMTSVMEGLSKVFAGNGGVEEIQKGLQSMIEKITSLAPQLLPVAKTIIISLIEGFGPMIPDLTSALFSVVITAITTFTSMIPQMMPAIISGIQGIIQATLAALPVIVQGLTQLLMALVTWISSGDNVQTFINGIIALVTELANSFAMLLPVLIPAIVTIIGEVAKALTNPDNIQMLLDAILTIVGALAVGIWNSLPIIVDAIKAIFKNLGELLSRFFEWAVPIAAQGIEAIVNTVKGWLNAVKTFVVNIITGIKNTLLGWINSIKQAFITGFTFVKEKISSILSSIGGFVKSVIDSIKELPSKVISIGKNLVEGLWKGINDKIGWVKDKIKGLGASITKAIKGVFGIHSPSKIWRKEIGQNLGLSVGLGFTDVIGDVQDDMINSMNGLTSNMTATVSANGSAGALTENNTTFNGSPITVIVNAAEGQSVNAIADAVIDKISNMTTRKGAVYA